MSSEKNKVINLSYNVPISEMPIEEGITDFIIGGTAINATVTSNNHKFLAEELKSSASSLTGVPLLVDHRNEVDAIKGRVILGSYDENTPRVNFKAKVMDNTIKEMVKAGLLNSVSVGASVKEIEEKDGVLIPRGIVFKELSLVAVPADDGATFTTAMFEAYKKETEIKTDNTLEKSTESLKGGLSEMTEEKAEAKNDVAVLMEAIESLKNEIKALKEKKEVPAEKAVVEEDKEDIKETGKYRIEQGAGSIRGSSFTLVR